MQKLTNLNLKRQNLKVFLTLIIGVFSIFFLFVHFSTKENEKTENFLKFRPLDLKENDEISNQKRICEPKTKIVFLKTHKCGSSTIQNIFLRFGAERKLIFVLPHWGNYYNEGKKFKASEAIEAPYETNQNGIVTQKFYNIFTHHTQFDYEEIRKIMPNDSIFISIIREPSSLFESIFYV